MGRAGITFRAPPALPLTPCENFLRGYSKDIVYCELPVAISDLSAKITQAYASIDEDTMKEDHKNRKNCLCFVLRKVGGRYDHLLSLKIVYLYWELYASSSTRPY